MLYLGKQNWKQQHFFGRNQIVEEEKCDKQLLSQVKWRSARDLTASNYPPYSDNQMFDVERHKKLIYNYIETVLSRTAQLKRQKELKERKKRELAMLKKKARQKAQAQS